MQHRIQALSHRLLMVLAIFAARGLSAGASTSARELEMELDRSSPLIPTQVTYERTQNGLKVKGRIEKKFDRYGRILGHAEIELVDIQDRVLACQHGELQHFNPRRKDPDWASFQTVIDTVPPAAVKLRVCHALGPRRCQTSQTD